MYTPSSIAVAWTSPINLEENDMSFLLAVLWDLWLIGWTLAGIGVLCYVIAYVNDEISGH